MSNLIVVVVIVIAAYVIWKLIQQGSNSVFATTPRIQPSQYMSEYVEPNASHLLLDVRTPQEFASGNIAGAANIPLQVLPQQMRDIPRDRPIIIYCRSGNRSRTAVQTLASAGYNDVYDLGGIIAWQRNGLPVQAPAY